MGRLTVIEWANLAATFFAAIAAVFSAIAIFFTRKTAAEQRASDSIKRYLELALQYPKLSTLKESDLEDWFVSFLLTAVQDVLTAYKGDKDRRVSMKNQLGLYRNSLIIWDDEDKKHHTNYIRGFGSEVEALVREVIREEAPE